MAIQGKIYAKRAIAQILELTEKRVEQLAKDGIIPEHNRGHFKLLPVIQGYVRYLRSQIADDDTTSDLNVERARLTRLKREDAELDLQVRRNELHRSGDVEFIMTNMLIAFKAKLETLPYKVLPSVMNVPEGDGKADSMTAILKSAIDEALTEISGYDPQLFDEENYSAIYKDAADGSEGL